ncbi:hypothetical protein IKQ74_01245 [Candidatus Saccharibacteria bacterium]|jgi:cell division protein FtsB|nr:hypothetical protein [Candidatus Saccharibacteria bacterium]
MWLKIQTFFRKIRYYAKRDIFTVRNIITVLAVLVCFYWAWGAIKSTARNWSLAEKLRSKELEAAKIELEVDKNRLEQQYYNTDEYKELMARTKLGKKAKDETMVILPENSEKARTKYIEKATEQSEFRSNFSQWLDFLFG